MDPEQNFIPDHLKLLEEIKQQVWFLENIKDLDQGDIAKNIGEYKSNFNDYMSGKKTPGSEIVTRMSTNLNRIYAEPLREWANTLSQPNDPYVYLTGLQKNKLRDQATINVLARRMGIPPEVLREEIEKEIEALSREKNQQ